MLKRVTSSLESRLVVKLFMRNLSGLRYSTCEASLHSKYQLLVFICLSVLGTKWDQPSSVIPM